MHLTKDKVGGGYFLILGEFWVSSHRVPPHGATTHPFQKRNPPPSFFVGTVKVGIVHPKTGLKGIFSRGQIFFDIVRTDYTLLAIYAHTG